MLLLRSKSSFALILLAASLASVSSVNAQNLLINGSFEQGNFVDNGQGVMSLAVGSTSITGWTTNNAELAWLHHPNPFPGVSASDGVYSLDLTGYHDSSPYGGVQQTLATVQNETYLLSFDLGGFGNSNANYSLTANAGITSQTFTYNPVVGGSDYGRFSMAFTATASNTVISLIGTTSGSGNYIALDNIVVTGPAAVPAPGSLITALIGVVPGVMLLRRRRKSVR